MSEKNKMDNAQNGHGKTGKIKKMNLCTGHSFYEVHGFEFSAKTIFPNNSKIIIGWQCTMSTYHWLNFSGLKYVQNISVKIKIKPKRYLQT